MSNKAKSKKDSERFKVLCTCCGGVFCETTEKFDASKPANPTMIRLLPLYSEYGWAEVVHDETCGYGDMICPECESMLAPNGRLTLI